MKTPESYLRQIEKLRTIHTTNAKADRHDLNNTVQRKIITAWEGYHIAIEKRVVRLKRQMGSVPNTRE